MKNEFIPYEQAAALKKLGFNEPCLLVYGNKKLHAITLTESSILLPFVINKRLPDRIVAAPLYQQAFRWFREKHEMVIDWYHSQHDNFGSYIGVCIKNVHLEETVVGVYKTYEEAEPECLKKLIEIVKT